MAKKSFRPSHPALIVLCVTQARRASRAGHAIDLQHREFLLLEQLMRHAGQMVTRSMLLEAAWDYDFEPRGNIIDIHAPAPPKDRPRIRTPAHSYDTRCGLHAGRR